MRDRSVLFWMEIATFFRFEKLGPNRYRRFVTPKPTKKIGTSGLLINPASRGDLGRPSLQVKPIAAWRNRLVSRNTFLGGISSKVEIKSELGSDLCADGLP
jgi:hypothetical protein